MPYGLLVPEIKVNCHSVLLLDSLIMQEGTSCQSGITLNPKLHLCARLNTRAGVEVVFIIKIIKNLRSIFGEAPWAYFTDEQFDSTTP